MTYKIVADSSADLRGLAQVAFASVPLKIITEEREFLDDDALDAGEMVEYLQAHRGRSGTACPSVGEFLEAFGEAERIFVLCITGTLSGCYQAAVEAGAMYEREHPGRRVCCIDTLSTGPEMALLAEKLEALIVSGLEFAEIEAQARAYLKTTRILYSLESLTNLARNGRVSPLIAKACGILGIRVVGTGSAEGTLQPLHKCRGEKKALECVVREMGEMGYRGGRVRISHCRNENAAQTLRGMLLAAYPGSEILVSTTGGLCSFYAEDHGFIIGFETRP